MSNDTIAAIATARGVAALAIIRLSGPQAVFIVDGLFRSVNLRDKPSHTVHVGTLEAPDGTGVDQVVITLFKAPRSVTGEDVVEISCHGGDRTQQQVLRALLDSGARLAEPGEFTRRAFVNGKIDLAQAEAVADLIHAHSTLAQRVSLSQLHGTYSAYISKARDRLLETCSLVELELDFAEEDVEFADRSQLASLLEETSEALTRLLGSSHLGVLIRDGVKVVIGGRPNAGKSTLLNALVGTDRAIVSEVAGTTRDEIEADIEIDGLLFRFVDTAGLRETTDVIEIEGVRRTHKAIGSSSVLLYVFDVTLGLDKDERQFLTGLAVSQPGLPIIVVANKTDLIEEAGRGLDVVKTRAEDPDQMQIQLSAKDCVMDSDALIHLRRELIGIVRGDLSDADASVIVTNERHRQHLANALDAVTAAQTQLESASGDILALDLRRALSELGAITGEVTTEDILGQIFSRFCIGK